MCVVIVKETAERINVYILYCLKGLLGHQSLFQCCYDFFKSYRVVLVTYYVALWRCYSISKLFVCAFSFGPRFFLKKFTPSPFEGFSNEICWLPYLNKNEDWEAGGSPVAECMLSMHEALNSIPITKKKRKRRMKTYFPNIY